MSGSIINRIFWDVMCEEGATYILTRCHCTALQLGNGKLFAKSPASLKDATEASKTPIQGTVKSSTELTGS